MREDGAGDLEYCFLERSHIGFGDGGCCHGYKIEGHVARRRSPLLVCRARLTGLFVRRAVAYDALEPGRGKVGKVREAQLR